MLTRKQRAAIQYASTLLGNSKNLHDQQNAEWLSSILDSAAPAEGREVECTCSAKDMHFGRCCKLASKAATAEAEPIVNAWLRKRGTSMDGYAYAAALDLVAHAKASLATAPTMSEAARLRSLLKECYDLLRVIAEGSAEQDLVYRINAEIDRAAAKGESDA